MEDQGLNVSIWRDKEDLYDTDGIDKVYLRQQVMAGHRQGHADFNWTGEGLRFYYVSPHTDIHLAVAGAVPSYPEKRVHRLVVEGHLEGRVFTSWLS